MDLTAISVKNVLFGLQVGALSFGVVVFWTFITMGRC